MRRSRHGHVLTVPLAEVDSHGKEVAEVILVGSDKGIKYLEGVSRRVVTVPPIFCWKPEGGRGTADHQRVRFLIVVAGRRLDALDLDRGILRLEVREDLADDLLNVGPGRSTTRACLYMAKDYSGSPAKRLGSHASAVASSSRMLTNHPPGCILLMQRCIRYPFLVFGSRRTRGPSSPSVWSGGSL